MGALGRKKKALLECDCCGFICCPNIAPAPLQLSLTLRTISDICGCLDGQVITMLQAGVTGGRYNYRAIWLWSCPDLFFPDNVTWFRFATSCGVGDAFPEIEVRSIMQDAADPEPDQADVRWGTIHIYYLDEGQCDPFYWHYNGVLSGDGVWVRCQDDFMDDPEIQMELTL